jgi:hypothetical protein
MGPPSYMRSVVERNVVMRLIPVTWRLHEMFDSEDETKLLRNVVNYLPGGKAQLPSRES